MPEPLKGSQERQLFLAIQAKGLVNSEFSLGTSPSGRPSVEHVDGYYFAFGLDSSGRHVADHRPGVDKDRDRVTTGTWDKQLARFNSWLDLVREELETPDLWGQLDDVRRLVDSWGVENSPFTEAEQSEIARRLGALESKIEDEFSLAHQELAGVQEGIANLVGASRAAGRRDWLIMVIGTFFSLVLPRGVAEHLLGTAFDALSGVFGADNAELPPGGGGPPKALQ